MLKYWPFKKDYLLVALAIFLAIVCYRFAIQNTLSAWRLNRELTGQLQESHDLSYQPGYLERKNKNLDRVLSLYVSDTTLFRSNTISVIAVLAEKNKVKLTGVPAQELFFHTEKSIMQRLSFEGDFFALISFLNQLESLDGVGIPKSVVFKTERKEIQLETNRLLMEVYMEIRK